MNVAESVLLQGINNDTAYFSRLVSDLSNPECESYAPIVSLCMSPYLSLFVYESNRKLEQIDPALASALSGDVQVIVERSRHTLKLFEDNKRGIEGQLAYFREEILPAHKDRFLGNTWLPFARPLERDLGLFSYEKTLILTTHGSNFFMGIEPGAIFAMTGEEMRGIYEAYGRYFKRLGAHLVDYGQTFVSQLDPKRFNQWPDDVRADKYYSRVFNGASNPDLNAMLTLFRGMMNFVDRIIATGTTTGGIDYTVFKIRYLTLHAILGSLKLLGDGRLHSLTARSAAYIDKIIGTAAAQLVIDPAIKPFRNTLMHYALDSRVDASSVDLGHQLFGLVPVYFPSHDVATFTTMVDQCISETTLVMEEWASV